MIRTELVTRLALVPFVAFQFVADATVRRGLALASLVALELEAEARVRRGLAIAALVAFNVAAAASVISGQVAALNEREASTGTRQAARASTENRDDRNSPRVRDRSRTSLSICNSQSNDSKERCSKFFL